MSSLEQEPEIRTLNDLGAAVTRWVQRLQSAEKAFKSGTETLDEIDGMSPEARDVLSFSAQCQTDRRRDQAIQDKLRGQTNGPLAYAAGVRLYKDYNGRMHDLAVRLADLDNVEIAVLDPVIVGVLATAGAIETETAQ